MRSPLLVVCLAITLLLAIVSSPCAATNRQEASSLLPIEALVGEELTYDISFLWFDRLAVGTIRLTQGERAGTYLASLEARTLGIAAFLTRDRIEKFQTLMEFGPEGLLRPIEFSTFSFKTKEGRQREKVTSYLFDYQRKQVKYQKVKDHILRNDELLPLETEEPVFDILSAFYNLRCGLLGPLNGTQISLPTFHRRGIEEIIIAPVNRNKFADKKFFRKDTTVRKVLVDPDVFKTSSRDIFVGFDQTGRPQRAVVKNVIGLGDVRGILRASSNRQVQQQKAQTHN